MRNVVAAGLLVLAAITGAVLGEVGQTERAVLTRAAGATFLGRPATFWPAADMYGSSPIPTASTPQQVMASVSRSLSFIVPAQELDVTSDRAEFVITDGKGHLWARVAVVHRGGRWQLSGVTMCIGGA